MALYDTQVSPEELIRPDRAGLASRFRKAQPFQATSGDTTGELTPAFIGGEVDGVSGNLRAGTVEGVKKGNQVTPFAPAAPASRLADV